MLNDLIGGIGASDERYSLLGALWKRRGDWTKAAQYYGEAYKLKRATLGLIDLYSGINWVQLSYVNGTLDDMLKDVANECIRQANLPKSAPDFWDRVGAADWLVTRHLIDGDLDAHIPEVVGLYQSAFQHAAANQEGRVARQDRSAASAQARIAYPSSSFVKGPN